MKYDNVLMETLLTDEKEAAIGTSSLHFVLDVTKSIENIGRKNMQDLTFKKRKQELVNSPDLLVHYGPFSWA